MKPVDSHIKNIIFDWGGVLINLNLPRCVKSFAALGLPVPAMNDLHEFYGKMEMIREMETGQIDVDEFCHQVRQRLTRPATNEEIVAAWNSLLEDIPPYRLEALVEVHKHYRTYLLSNTSDLHWEGERAQFNWNGYVREDYFDHIFVSYQMHLSKPDLAIYETLLQQAGIKGDETLFIDDSPRNCLGAEAAGIHSYCLAPHEDWREMFALT